ncbi:YifB family Mg chelatase-like AAA ATPase [Anaerotalea alkaliphila]|uniref:YifB family Mg chelatase-like AAA ATPase n=1 Tax=Anaerotalea alkaliphila TaxID=2662126 RepID=A0A7X5HT42_9FIRM|nr:YifB family Mg chelatase-like AAA ATPase [Anaerotalea alkaliphila]NDL66148.1 YifB family Mg chelatase-like AAA ATPase [Anaerotalea alkaliphila]
MYVELCSASVSGIEGRIIRIEVDVSEGFPRFDLVGLPDSSVRESVERVRTALRNGGYGFPYKRITVNLSPADLRKVGPVYDLPIALGILACMGRIPLDRLQEGVFLGELSLSGEVRAMHGVLPMAMEAQRSGFKACYVPLENAGEGMVLQGVRMVGVRNLGEAVDLLTGGKPPRIRNGKGKPKDPGHFPDMGEVRGQPVVKRALEIAAAGGHNLLLVGPPGSGKSMLAERMGTILPVPSLEERMELTRIYSVAGKLEEAGVLVSRRPFRAPHQNISAAALLGGGRGAKLGEITLAHQGVLFLDELPEFRRDVLESLRQPMEKGAVTISRVGAVHSYPSRFLLVAAMNPCACGYYPDLKKCGCSLGEVERYQKRISGPFLDRIDMVVEVRPLTFEELARGNGGETSAQVRERVVQARHRQQVRNGVGQERTNGALEAEQVQKHCLLEAAAGRLLEKAFAMHGMSARAYHKVLKVARTIADLDGADAIGERHVAEAVQYRSLDRNCWAKGHVDMEER